MDEYTNDFRPLGPGWYTRFSHDGTTIYTPCPGLICDSEAWSPAEAHGGAFLPSQDETPDELVYRPDLAHLPGELEVKVVGGVEYVRQSVPVSRRVLGPDTPFPGAKSAYSAEA